MRYPPAMVSPSLSPDIHPKRFTRDEYHRLIAVGFLTEGDCIELIRGELIQMAAKGTAHAVCTSKLVRQLDRLLGDHAVIRGQEPVALSSHSEPEPDVAIAMGTDDDYLDHHPEPKDLLLVVEVADSTLAYDQTTKLQLYAEAGIAHYWIMNLVAQQLEQYSHPYCTATGYYDYQQRTIVLPPALAPLPGFGDLALDLTRLFPGAIAP